MFQNLEKVFIVAEIGASHCRSFETAKGLIRSAKSSGADAVKIQIFTPDDMTLNVDDERFKITDGQWSGMTLYELYSKAALPLEWIPELQKYAKEIGITFFGTVYSQNRINQFDLPIYKIASFEILDLKLIEEVAKTRKPIILSTGMADLSEILNAVETIKEYHDDFALLHCVSKYPAKFEEMKLATIPDLEDKFGCTVGLSDHSRNLLTSSLAIAMGAKIIEVHISEFGDESLDSKFALDPFNLDLLVTQIRQTEKAIGLKEYGGEKKFRRKPLVYAGKTYWVRSVPEETYSDDNGVLISQHEGFIGDPNT